MMICDTVILILILGATRGGGRCLDGHQVPEQKFFYHNNERQVVTVLVNHRVDTRLVGSVFSIFAREVLGYTVETVISKEVETNLDTETIFSRLSSCKNELSLRLSEKNMMSSMFFTTLSSSLVEPSVTTLKMSDTLQMPCPSTFIRNLPAVVEMTSRSDEASLIGICE